jgi:hypothetical protein
VLSIIVLFIPHSENHTPNSRIPELAEKYYNLSSIKINDLLYASRMAAKVDNAAIQEGVKVESTQFLPIMNYYSH